jgi:hypothetical protein
MEWAQVLVIILSIFLGLFLLVGIILTILLIKLTRQINAVTSSAQRTAESVEKAVVGFTTVTSPMFLVKTLSKHLKKFKGK